MIPILINPATGRGIGAQKIPLIQQTARHLGWEGEVRVLEDSEDIATVVDDYLEAGVSHIIIGGGDGTITASLPPLVKHGATLGILPIGTGNLIALNLNIPREATRSLKVALKGDPKAIDLGRVNGRYFSVICGLGLDGALMRDAHPQLKRHFGLFAYLWGAVKNISHPHDIYSIKIDGKRVGHYIAKTVMVSNMGIIAPRVKLFPAAEPDDGILDVAVFQSETLGGWLRLCVNTITGRVRQDPGTVFFRGKEVEIYTSSGDRFLQVDGDFYSQTDRLEATILKGPIKIMTPALDPHHNH